MGNNWTIWCNWIQDWLQKLFCRWLLIVLCSPNSGPGLQILLISRRAILFREISRCEERNCYCFRDLYYLPVCDYLHDTIFVKDIDEILKGVLFVMCGFSVFYCAKYNVCCSHENDLKRCVPVTLYNYTNNTWELTTNITFQYSTYIIIYTNEIEGKIVGGLFINDMTDHLPVFAIF